MSASATPQRVRRPRVTAPPANDDVPPFCFRDHRCSVCGRESVGTHRVACGETADGYVVTCFPRCEAVA